MTFTGRPTEAIGYVSLTKTHIIVSGFRYSGDVECATSTYVLWSAPRAGGTATLLTKGHHYGMGRAVADGEYIYWMEPAGPDGGTIRRSRVDGGPILDLAKSVKMNYRIEVDGNYVYWLDGAQRILRVPK